MKYIASCSFGKDSLAAIIARMEHGEPIDGAVYCRIMFDEETSAELPEHEEWIHNHAIPLLRSRYGIKTTIVQEKHTYVEIFYSHYQKGRHIGQIYGFPLRMGPWCNSMLKIRPIKAWQKQAGECISLIGIAADEPKRIARNTAINHVLPLVDYGITEAQAFDICKSADLLSPAYSGDRCRLGCWFCHNQRIGELKRLRKEYPTLYCRLMKMETVSPFTFKQGKTLRDYDERFTYEDAQLTLFDLFKEEDEP